MAIERMSPHEGTLPPSRLLDNLQYLWSLRKLIVGIAILVGILTYGLTWLIPEEFEAKGAVYVARMSIYDIPPLNPATAATLAKNPELLRAVYDDFAAKFGTKPGDFEKFVKQFDIKSETLQDTTVKKEVSPVLEMSVRFRGREQTKFLLEAWQKHFIQKFGNVSLEEARLRAESMDKRARALEGELSQLDAEKAQLAARLVRERKFLAETLDVLAPSELPEESERAQIIKEKGGSNVQLNIFQPVPKPEGLLGRYWRLQWELARARAGLADPSTTPVARLVAEESVLSATIATSQHQIEQIEKRLASTAERLAVLSRLIEEKSTELQHLHSALDIYRNVAACYVPWDGRGLPKGSDLQVISAPVMPELRVWPKRTLIAGIAALLAVVLVSALLLLRHMLDSEAAAPSEQS